MSLKKSFKKFSRTLNKKLVEISPITSIPPFNKVKDDGRNHVGTMDAAAPAYGDFTITMTNVKNALPEGDLFQVLIRLSIKYPEFHTNKHATLMAFTVGSYTDGKFNTPFPYNPYDTTVTHWSDATSKAYLLGEPDIEEG